MGYVTGLDQSWVISAISTIITIVILYYGIKTYKSKNGNYLTIKEAIKTGLAIAAIGGIIGALYSFLHYTFIQPEFIEAIREKAYLDMTTQNPNMTDEQLATGNKMMNIFTSPFLWELWYYFLPSF